MSTPDVVDGLHTSVAAWIARGIVKAASHRVDVGFTQSDGTTWGSADPAAPVIHLTNPDSFYRRLGRDAKMAFGEAYVAGDWEPGPGTDLADLLTPFAARLQDLVPAPLRRMRMVIDRRLPHDTRNTPHGARSNISAHYDMSNELFATFLDETMTYSSAWFADPEHEPLESAQTRKIDGILDYAGVGAGTRVLEIGSGWGSLAIRAAQRGARVTTITLSEQQAHLANIHIKRLGLDPLVEVRLQDYRDVEGEFDAIVSVEMIEAVGEEFWPSYFSTIDAHLAPGGRVAIQAITMAHERMLATRNSYGWIQKHIFPGGLIPSIQAIEEVCRQHTTLRISQRRELGVHYAETLRRWRLRFIAHWDDVASLGYDEDFRRIWEFYLAYCEAGFKSRYLGVSQIGLVRPPRV
ncbi:MAG: cyclopropane-fatty-acyl-phospholipid synthase family protein [Nocardioidaceae bacterium]